MHPERAAVKQPELWHTSNGRREEDSDCKRGYREREASEMAKGEERKHIQVAHF